MISNNTREIQRAGVLSYVAFGIDIVTGVLFTPWMIKNIGQSAYSLYILVFSLISMFTIDFGISMALARFVSKGIAENNQRFIDNLLGVAYKLYLLIALIISICLILIFFYIDAIYIQLTQLELELFKSIYIIAAVYSGISFPFMQLNGILISYEKQYALKFFDISSRLLYVVSLSIALLMGYGVYALVAVQSAVGICIIISKLIYIYKRTPIHVAWQCYDTKIVKKIFGFSVWITLISITQRFGLNLAPTILGIVSGSHQIAIFGVARILEGYVSTFGSTFNSFFLTKVSRMITDNKKKDEILDLMIRVGRIQLLIIGLIFVGFISIGKDFLNTWIGNSYSSAYECVILFMIPIIIFYPQEIANTYLTAVNKVSLKALSYACEALSNILLSFAFSYWWGAIGAAIAYTVAAGVRILIINLIYHKIMGINIRKFAQETYFKFALPLLITIILGLIIEDAIYMYGWSGILIKGLVVITTYSICMWMLVMNSYEKQLFYELIKVLGRKG